MFDDVLQDVTNMSVMKLPILVFVAQSVLAATCVDLAQARYPGAPIKPMEGRSLTPAFAGKTIEPHAPLAIGLIEDPVEGCSGPIWLRGGVALISADGRQYEVRNNMTVCRCGASKNKPFCDGSRSDFARRRMHSRKFNP